MIKPTTVTKYVLAAIVAATSFQALAEDLPGTGKTVRFARNDSLGAQYIQDYILISALKDLGYEVKLSTLGLAAAFQAAAQGDLDMSGDVNMPQRAPQYETVKETVALVGNGTIEGGGINGYVIDKATAEKHNITDVGKLKEPELAKLFDTDGDGKANLMNCDPGWSCGDVVDFQLNAFGLSETVESIRAKYEPLMGETFARFKQGEPVLYYTWSPSFVTEELQPGRDVVWLPIPFDALPEGVTAGDGHEVKGVVGCAGGQDPCRMATGSWNWKIFVNREFLNANPAVQNVAENAHWPLQTWSSWEGKMKADNSDKAIEAIANEWIASNKAQYDAWVEAARKAAQ